MKPDKATAESIISRPSPSCAAPHMHVRSRRRLSIVRSACIALCFGHPITCPSTQAKQMSAPGIERRSSVSRDGIIWGGFEQHGGGSSACRMGSHGPRRAWQEKPSERPPTGGLVSLGNETGRIPYATLDCPTLPSRCIGRIDSHVF